jgi:hypothetical protein
VASPAQSRVFDAYCAELGIDPKVARHSFMTFIEATRWWNSGAPELYEGPTRGSEALVHYRAAVAAGVDGGGPEFRAILVRADYQERLDRVMPDPARPGWRAPRSKYAPSAQEREACGNDSDD